MTSVLYSGLVVATVLPFDMSGEVDWRSYGRVLDYCAVPDITTAVFVNGHAGEAATLDDATRLKVLRETRAAVGGKPIMSGVIAMSTAEAVRQAKLAEDAGADCVVAFPLPQLQAGGNITSDAALAYIGALADAVRAPISIFQQPVAGGAGYSAETLRALAGMPQIAAIKEGGDNITLYEDNWHGLKAINPSLSILPSNYDWFLPQLAIGADGILSGLASLLPHDLHALWRAAERRDLDAMRAANNRIRPIVRCVYGVPPRMDMHTRIKVGLEHLGIIDCARPRAPLQPARDGIRRMMEEVISRHTFPDGSPACGRAA
jgi:4-hydroxy-tetrahydrodipicolinate synthase